MSETPNKLKKNLSFFSMISIACGAVIGGWLTESPYWFELTGSTPCSASDPSRLGVCGNDHHAPVRIFCWCLDE